MSARDDLMLHRKLAEVMREAERIPKRGKAPPEMGGYPFVQVGDAADHIRKALGERHVSMLPTMIEIVDQSEHPTSKGGTATFVGLRITWTLTDGESGETATLQSYGVGADRGDKYSGKATTNAMKYALMSGFLLSSGDDVERDSVERGRRQPERPAVAAEPSSEPFAATVDGRITRGRSAPVDGLLRQSADGPLLGFVVEAEDHKRLQVVAQGPLADALATVGVPFDGWATVHGLVERVPWKKEGKDMPPYQRMRLARIETAGYTLPAPAELVGETEELGL